MNLKSMRVQLTAWYAIVLMATFAVAGVGTWLAMRDSIDDTVDDELRARLALLGDELTEAVGVEGVEHLDRKFDSEHTTEPGARFRVSDGRQWLYQSPGAQNWGGRPLDPSTLPADGEARTLIVAGQPLRLLAAPVAIAGAAWAVEIGTPINEFYEALNEVAWTLLIASPLVLLLASAGGYWASARALRPVDRITRLARAIGAQNLAERLPLRGADDELDRLSETLNGMFARLDEAFRKITQFTADASHELRTPVAIIRTTAELTRRRPRTQAEYEEALDRILAESERTSRLIEDLLMLARADAEVENLVSEPMDLVRSLRDACEEGRILADAADLEFSVEAPSSCPTTGDPQAIRRLFLILIDNAVKYTPSGGVVRVTMIAGTADATVEVQDTGPGIPADELPHLFDRFYRVGKDRSRESGGVGLGLSIARSIAIHHKGEMTVESRLGAGSTFRVRFPIVPPVI